MSNARRIRRCRVDASKRLFKLDVGNFRPIDLNAKEHPIWMTRAFMNNRYIVMINDNAKTTKGNAVQALIQKLDDTPIFNHWSELQKIKNELFGSDVMGIEYYPKQSELMDDHNIYWLWIFPDGVLPIPKL